MKDCTIHSGCVAHLTADPFVADHALEIMPGGALAVDGAGRIAAMGPRRELLRQFSGAEHVDHGNAWLLPGMVDAHLHFPQFYATAAAASGLLEWLDKAVFPAEMAYGDEAFAATAASRFVARLLAAGTTTAMVFGSQFPAATQALFDAAGSAGLRLISGITLMDRGGPAELLRSPNRSVDAMEALIARCAGAGRLHYAITPRYALSCSTELLEACGDLLRRHPDCRVQTHINESTAEVAAVGTTFRWARDYLDIYEHYGLVASRTVLAHSIHTTEPELQRMAALGCAVCHCPSSNLFLGSGLFRLRDHWRHRIPIAVGTDIGAGSHFSLWRELAEVYKVQQLVDFRLGAAQLLYLATLGGARALGLQGETGNFVPGKSADFLVLDVDSDPYLVERLSRCESYEAQLFCLIHLAGEVQMRRVITGGTLFRADAGKVDPEFPVPS